MDIKKENLVMQFSQAQIQQINAGLAERISNDYRNKVDETNPLHIVITLKGALMFGADLSRLIELPTQIDFVRAASYGSATKSSGNVQIVKDVETDLNGKHVLLLDEIVDSGYTIDFLTSMFEKKLPSSFKVCTLLNKPSRREVEVKVDYVGTDVDDKFLVGYGLDYKEQFRNLADVFAVES